MKHLTLNTYACMLLITTVMYSCKSKDPQAELQSLKAEKTAIEQRIAALERELGKDSSLAIEVSATEIKPEAFKTYIDVQGRVEAEESVSLSSEIPGMVTQIYVRAGDAVKTGQVLAETDSRIIHQQISDLEINLDLAKQVFEKQSKLWNDQIGTELQFLQAKTTKESLEKKIETLKQQLTMTKIVSPISGIVDAVNVKIGQAIVPGIPAINVVNLNNLKMVAELAESYTGKVKKGQTVQAFFPDQNLNLESSVHYASKIINPLSRTFQVTVFLNNTAEVSPNAVVKLQINDYTSSPECLSISEKFIQKSGNECYVWVAEKQKAQKKTVSLGRNYRGRSEILSGLKPGDLIITQGFDLVKSNDPVNVIQKNANPL
ncbi:MAG: efflux RND transporter periplasmic adaptor subunit [Bacteroidia bacterium]|nr:efflux RND transporter periplasmic adaptor subunit [Bacteroidia bacterium]